MLRAGLEVKSRLDPKEAAFTADSLCHALLVLAAAERPRHAVGGQAALHDSCRGERAAGEAAAVQETVDNLARIDAALSALP